MMFLLIWCFSIAEAAFCQCQFTSDVPSAIFLDFPIIIPSFPLTPGREVNLEPLDDSKFKG